MVAALRALLAGLRCAKNDILPSEDLPICAAILFVWLDLWHELLGASNAGEIVVEQTPKAASLTLLLRSGQDSKEGQRIQDRERPQGPQRLQPLHERVSCTDIDEFLLCYSVLMQHIPLDHLTMQFSQRAHRSFHLRRDPSLT